MLEHSESWVRKNCIALVIFDLSLLLESDEQKFTEYDQNSDDDGIVPKGASPTIAVEVMYESEES